MEYGDKINLESAALYRRWSAIGAIAAALEQKVWIQTSSKLYPNLYTVLVGNAGVGKTRAIMKAREFLATLEKFHFAPKDNPSWAALADALLASICNIADVHGKKAAMTYNSMMIVADEITAFMSDYEGKMIGGLTTVYDVTVPYEEWKRGKELRIRIPSPQINILAGSTPSNLLKFIPDYAWEQGFTSRLILVYANERIVGDDFIKRERDLPSDLTTDIATIYSLQGEFDASQEFRDAVNDWRGEGEPGQLSHPKLAHYNSRRRAHLYKLSMVASVDRGNDLKLLAQDFQRAREWLTEAEASMHQIFETGMIHTDSKLTDELVLWIDSQGKPVSYHAIVHRIGRMFPNYAVMKVFDLMVLGGRIYETHKDNRGWGYYRVKPEE